MQTIRSNIKKIKNNVLRQKMDARRNVLYDISTKQLLCNGHVMRMKEERIPTIVHEWSPIKKKKGRPQILSKPGILEAMRDRPSPFPTCCAILPISFEAMTGHTAPSSDGLLAEVFLSCKANTRRSVHSPRIISLSPLSLATDVTDARHLGKVAFG